MTYSLTIAYGVGEDFYPTYPQEKLVPLPYPVIYPCGDNEVAAAAIQAVLELARSNRDAIAALRKEIVELKERLDAVPANEGEVITGKQYTATNHAPENSGIESKPISWLLKDIPCYLYSRFLNLFEGQLELSTVGDLLNCTWHRVRAGRQFGSRCCAVLLVVLTRHGLKLSGPPPSKHIYSGGLTPTDSMELKKLGFKISK